MLAALGRVNSSSETGTKRTSRPVAAAISADRLGERQQPRAGQLVDLARVPVLGQRRDRDVGDVVDVDERLRHVAGRQRDLAGQDRRPAGSPR